MYVTYMRTRSGVEWIRTGLSGERQGFVRGPSRVCGTVGSERAGGVVYVLAKQPETGRPGEEAARPVLPGAAPRGGPASRGDVAGEARDAGESEMLSPFSGVGGTGHVLIAASGESCAGHRKDVTLVEGGPAVPRAGETLGTAPSGSGSAEGGGGGDRRPIGGPETADRRPPGDPREDRVRAVDVQHAVPWPQKAEGGGEDRQEADGRFDAMLSRRGEVGRCEHGRVAGQERGPRS